VQLADGPGDKTNYPLFISEFSFSISEQARSAGTRSERKRDQSRNEIGSGEQRVPGTKTNCLTMENENS
jgi:hypothetical protein